MPVPNEADVTYLDQSELDAGDFTIIENVASGYSVVSGGVVTAQGSPNGSVAVSAGTARVAGVNKTISAGNVSVISGSANPDSTTANAADATNARFSLITINSSSQLGVVHGTPAGLSPNNDGSYLCVFPTFAGKTVLAAVFVPPTFTTVATTQISTKRIVSDPNAMHDEVHAMSIHTGTASAAQIASDAVTTVKIADNAVTLAKIAPQADQTFLANISGGTAVPVAATVAQVITALQGQVGGLPYVKELASNFLFTVSNTTLQSVTGLTFNIGTSATEVWLVEVYLELTAANATMDAKWGWATMPTSATMRWGFGAWIATGTSGGAGYLSVTTSSAVTGIADQTGVFPHGTLAGTQGVSIIGKVYGGGTGGAIQLQGAQNTSDGGQLTALAGSVLRATKIKA